MDGDWREHRRDEDDELLGFLRPVPGEPGRFVPVTVFGHPLGEAGDADDAGRVLDAVGLSYLADRWLLTIPERAEPIAVQIVEASPQRVRLRSVDFGYEGDIGTIFTLPAPPGDALRRG